MNEMIPGIEFDFGGGRVLTVPPLSLGALQRLRGNLEGMSAANALDASTLKTVVQATHAALKRNYPTMTEEDVADLIDVGNMHDVIGCVLDVAGIKRKAAADAKNQTAQPATPPGPTGPA